MTLISLPPLALYHKAKLSPVVTSDWISLEREQLCEVIIYLGLCACKPFWSA